MQKTKAYFAEVNFKLLKWLYKQLSLDIRFYAKRAAYYYNKSYLEGPRFKEGDRVYLLRKNIKTDRSIDKLDYKKIRLFKVTDVIRPVNYRLELLIHMRINPVFYISLLEPVPDNVLTIVPELAEEGNESIKYEVEGIINQTTDSQGQ